MTPQTINVTVADVAEAGPVVTSLFVSSDLWSAAFLNDLQTTGAGETAFGYSLPSGANQTDTLSWININLVSIRFSENVNVAFDNLQIRGINEAVYDLDPTFGLGGIAYDSTTFTATWCLHSSDVAAFDIDKVVLDLDGDVGGVTSVANSARLDGEHTPQDSAMLPSGNGTQGGDFRFEFHVLPGDVNNMDGINGSDTISVRNAQFQFSGDTGYSIALDVNGSGGISVADVVLVRNRQFSSLPAGSPAIAASQVSGAASEVANEISTLAENSRVAASQAVAIQLVLENPQ